uniref:Uncharacterized protein n=1 Tax=Corethron hystrix TaxID=216773 RepID=A0A7S1BMG6_9STRA|mmetsp:Transcript_32380/g.74564  ORF Transcript_32380/g.74564 Transcript_32380/m.74564 type:complete len:133 (+) Transcript_32380:170-568(+)
MNIMFGISVVPNLGHVLPHSTSGVGAYASCVCFELSILQMNKGKIGTLFFNFVQRFFFVSPEKTFGHDNFFFQNKKLHCEKVRQMNYLFVGFPLSRCYGFVWDNCRRIFYSCSSCPIHYNAETPIITMRYVI